MVSILPNGIQLRHRRPLWLYRIRRPQRLKHQVHAIYYTPVVNIVLELSAALFAIFSKSGSRCVGRIEFQRMSTVLKSCSSGLQRETEFSESIHASFHCERAPNGSLSGNLNTIRKVRTPRSRDNIYAATCWSEGWPEMTSEHRSETPLSN